jgi:cobalt-zinc-cadmium efflux system protein
MQVKYLFFLLRKIQFFATMAAMGHHHHHHGHDHHHAPQQFTVAFALAVGLNLLFTIVEAIYAIIAHSMSLLSDAGHNLGDVLGLALSWGALWLLSKKATDKYSYGFKRTTILAALLNALLLVIATVAITIESIHKLLAPSLVNEKIIIIVALIGILINGGTALLFSKGQHDLNIKSAFLHLAYDALISLGVVFTGVIIYYTHWLWLDPLVGIAIAITIFLGTWSLLRQSIDLILDAVPKDVDRDAVIDYLLSYSNISAVHDLHIWGLSTQEIAITAHLIVPNHDLSDEQLHTIHEDLASKFHIKHATLQTESGNTSDCKLGEKCC